MKQLYRDYLELLRAFIQGSHPDLSDEVDWNEILHIARINSTVGIVGYVLMMNPGLADPGFQAFMRMQCLSEIALYSRRADERAG